MTKKQRKKRIKAILVCSGLLIALYYVLPLLGIGMGEAEAGAYLNTGLLQMVFPLYLYITAVYLGVRHGFCSIYAVAAAVLFLPTLLFYFAPAIWYAALIYGGIALAGNLMGYGLRVFLAKWKQQT